MVWGKLFGKEHRPRFMALEIWKYIGPGLLVTVGFIDPGNWASNVAAGADYGYSLLWMVTLSTVMLIILQHNAAHLGIATGYCLSEAAAIYTRPWVAWLTLGSAMLASSFTTLAEILGAAIALQMLFGIPIKVGAVMVAILISALLFANSYQRLERWIIGFVSLIGLSFIFELSLVRIDWPAALTSWVTPSFPQGSLPIIMSVLGAVVMPHNLYLHSEIIQSRQWNLQDETIIRHQLKYEFYDTLISMVIGWAINSAMILLAAATFFQLGAHVNQLEQAQSMLKPLLGNAAAVVFALALLMAGLSSSVTAGIAGGSIFAGLYREPYDIHDNHSRWGVGITIGVALAFIFFVKDAFQGLIVSQMLLSIQLPITIFLQIYLTSSPKVMGKYVNSGLDRIALWAIGIVVTILNLMLFWSYIR